MAKSTQERLSAVLGKQGVSRQRADNQNAVQGITGADILASKAKKDEIELIFADARKLKPYAKNAMVHEPEQIKQVADSITEYGFTIPILIDENWEILAGHARREASLLLKRYRVPCIVRRDLSESQKMAYRLADNKLARNSEFEWQMVSDELKTLQAAGYDLSLTGFRDYESDALIQGRFVPPTEVGENDAFEEWQNMPEFQQDNLLAKKSIKVNFLDEKALHEFAKLINQSLTMQTRSFWFPYQSPANLKALRFTHESEISNLHSVEK